MVMRKSIGALCAVGAMATAIGLAGCADSGTGYASGYGSGYAGSGYVTAGDYGPGYDTLGYDDGDVWLGGLYGGGGYGWWGGHDRDHAYRWGGFAGIGHVGSAVSHGGFGGGVMHASASPGGFGGGHFGGGFGGGGHGGGGGGHR